MSLPAIRSSGSPVDLDEDSSNVNKKLSLLKHMKKKSANDAQLLMYTKYFPSYLIYFTYLFFLRRNRIALIQKEEERARKKIQETKERAAEIIALRNESERRVAAYVNAAGEVRQLQQVLIAKNREQDTEGKKARQQRLQMIHNQRKEEVGEMLMEKKYLTQLMLQEQSREVQLKQQKREQVKRMEEEMKRKKEQERQERERKRKEQYQKKLMEEAEEAKRAEKLVKILEKKEREWISKLKSTQTMQDTAFEQLENALSSAVPRVSRSRVSNSQGSESLPSSEFFIRTPK
jgi:DNA repair exonuclease SbcCD ATPase subunit